MVNETESLISSGLAHMAEANPAEALVYFDRALELEPRDASHHWHRGIALMALGDYGGGFAEIDGDEFASLNDHAFRDYGVPRWRGEDLGDGRKRMLVYHEWGLGDSIMMLRYLPLIGAEVTVAVPKPLERLTQRTGFEVVNAQIPIQLFDCYCPMMRLPRFFPTIPSSPYIRPDPELQKQWREQLNGKRRVGIAWSGNPKHKRDATRSMPLAQFLELLPLRDCALYALQNHDQENALAHGVQAFEFEDFADVAALASLMDVIVVVDTACANLVGALGHPAAHVLLDYAHDWRWYRGVDWYPTLKQHRQKAPGDWPSAFAELGI